MINTGDFEPILDYAIRASFAYENAKAICAKYPRAQVFNLPSLGMQMFLDTDSKNKSYYISIRGTANAKTTFEDLEYKKIYSDKLGIYLHEGFYKYAEACYKEVRPALVQDYKVHVCGHSLGGAAAAILLMMLHEDGLKLGQSYSYGAPKLTNKAGVRKYKDLPLIRVVNQGDPVPYLPPTTLLTLLDKGIYRHFGETIVLTEDGYSYTGEKASDSIWFSSFWTHLFHERVENHFMKSYLKRLSKMQSTE